MYIFSHNTFFLCNCTSFGSLGEPVDLDLNSADGKTGTFDEKETTVQLRPKAPSKPPRTFVSTDLDNPNYRIDRSQEVDVSEGQGFEAGAAQKSELSSDAINLQDNGNDERVLVNPGTAELPLAVKSKPKKTKKSKKSKSKTKQAEEHVYAVIDKKSKKQRKSSRANDEILKENIYEEIGEKLLPPALPPSPPPPLLKQLSIIGAPEEPTDENVDEKATNNNKSKKQVKKLDPASLLQSSTEAEITPEVLKPLPDRKNKMIVPEIPLELPNVEIKKIENVEVGKKDDEMKKLSISEDVQPILSDEKSDKLNLDPVKNDLKDKQEEGTNENSNKFESVNEIQNDRVITDEGQVLNPIAMEESISDKIMLETESLKKDFEDKSTENELSLDSGISLDEIGVQPEKEAFNGTLEDKFTQEHESNDKTMGILKEKQSFHNQVETPLKGKSVIQPESVISEKNVLDRKAKPEIIAETKVDQKDPRHSDLPSIPKQNQPEPTEKKNSVIQSQSGIIRNPLARKVKTEPKPDKDNQYVNEDSNKTEPEVNKVVLKQESLIQPENNEIIEDKKSKVEINLKNNQNIKDANNIQSEKTELKMSALNPLVGRKSKKTAPDIEPVIDIEKKNTLDVKIINGTSKISVDKTSPSKTSILNPLANRKSKKMAPDPEAEVVLKADNLPNFRMAPKSTVARLPGTRSTTAASEGMPRCFEF